VVCFGASGSDASLSTGLARVKVGLLVPSEAATKEETVNHRLGRHGVRTLIVIRFRSPFDFPQAAEIHVGVHPVSAS
jgi:hypothetical protein